MVEEPTNDSEPWKKIAEARNLETLHFEISRLPNKYREVLVLYHFEGKSRSQIASLLDCTTASVKACLARAREQLRQRLLQRGITASLALACAAAASQKAQADAPLVLDSLIRSTLDHCQGLEPTVDVGNGPGFVESLLAKETSMTIGTIHALFSGVVGVTLLCVATVAAIAASPQDDVATQSSGNRRQIIVTESVLETVGENSSGEGEVQIRKTDTKLPNAVADIAEIHTVTTHRTSSDGTETVSVSPFTAMPSVTAHASQPLSMLLVKSNGTNVVYSTPKVSTKQVPQKYTAGAQYQENGETKTRTEQRTRTTHVTTLTGEKVDMPMPGGTVFESLDGHELPLAAMLQRIGEDELPVIVLGGKQELPSDWKRLLNSDTVIARHDALVGHFASGGGQRVHRVYSRETESTKARASE